MLRYFENDFVENMQKYLRHAQVLPSMEVHPKSRTQRDAKSSL